MGFTDVVIIAAIVLVIGGAVAYIIKAKKSGKRCIGCPDACTCQKGKCSEGSCGSCSNCGDQEK